MWPFRRRPDPDRGGVAPGPAPGPGEPAVHRGEWRGLPPIQRVVTPATTTFGAGPSDSGPFEAGLATRQSPALLDRLGHFVAPDAPSGTFEAVARPVGRHTFPPPPGSVTALPLDDPPHGLAPLPEPIAAWPSRPLLTAPTPTPPLVQRRAEVSAVRPDDGGAGPNPATPQPGSTGTSDPDALGGALPTESGLPTGSTLPTAPLVSTPLPPVSLSRVGPTAPISRPAASPSADSSSSASPSGTSSVGDPVATPPAAGSPQRAGLGAALPPGASRLPPVQREPAPSPGPPAPRLDLPTSPTPASSAESGSVSADAPSHPDPPSDATGHEVVVAPLVGLRRAPTMGSSAVDAPEAGGSLEAAVPRQAAALVTAPDPFRSGAEEESGTAATGNEAPVLVAPLMGDRPLSALPHAPPPTGARPAGGAATPGAIPYPVAPRVASVQRAGAADPPRPTAARTPAAEHTGAGTGTGFVDAGAVAVAAGIAHRAADGSVVFGPGASSPAAERSLPAPSGRESSPTTSAWASSPGQVSTLPPGAAARSFAVQRARADSPVIARPFGLQRALADSSAPTTDRDSAVRRLPTGSPGTATPTRRFAAQRTDQPVASWAPLPVQPLEAAAATPSSAPTNGVTVQREDAPAEVSSPPPAEPPAATPDPGAAAALASAAAAPGAAGAASATMTDREVDRLARRLYPRLRDHLRGELRLDRERLGRASDVGLRN